jgi:hypothetical protein
MVLFSATLAKIGLSSHLLYASYPVTSVARPPHAPLDRDSGTPAAQPLATAEQVAWPQRLRLLLQRAADR